jgi:hypothetical protein
MRQAISELGERSLKMGTTLYYCFVLVLLRLALMQTSITIVCL